MSNIDYAAIGAGAKLVVKPHEADENYVVDVDDAFIILTAEGEETSAYLVHVVNSLSGRFIVGDGEIVSIVNG